MNKTGIFMQNKIMKTVCENNKKDSLYLVQKDSFVKNMPLGYRFTIVGDFDGNGKTEILKERHISPLTGKEATTEQFSIGSKGGKTYPIDNTGILHEQRAVSFMECTNKRIRNLAIGPHYRTASFAFIRNIGNIDGVAGDEVSFVIDGVDYSGINHCEIASYRHGAWRTIYSFPIMDYNIHIWDNTAEDGLPNADSLRYWKGLVKHIKPGKTLIFTETKYDIDDTTLVLDFRKPQKPDW
jgi:hypothetical protein